MCETVAYGPVEGDVRIGRGRPTRVTSYTVCPVSGGSLRCTGFPFLPKRESVGDTKTRKTGPVEGPSHVGKRHVLEVGGPGVQRTLGH